MRYSRSVCSTLIVRHPLYDTEQPCRATQDTAAPAAPTAGAARADQRLRETGRFRFHKRKGTGINRWTEQGGRHVPLDQAETARSGGTAPHAAKLDPTGTEGGLDGSG